MYVREGACYVCKCVCIKILIWCIVCSYVYSDCEPKNNFCLGLCLVQTVKFDLIAFAADMALNNHHHKMEILHCYSDKLQCNHVMLQ